MTMEKESGCKFLRSDLESKKFYGNKLKCTTLQRIKGKVVPVLN
jgi:hypothetical protein